MDGGIIKELEYVEKWIENDHKRWKYLALIQFVGSFLEDALIVRE